MNSEASQRNFFVRFFNELALYSGQYALFYLVMQFSSEGGGFWSNRGHVALLIALLIQTTALVFYGERIAPRIALSFLSLVVYTLFELQEGGVAYSLAHTGHLFFWLSTLLLAALQYLSHVTKRQNIRLFVEFLVSNINMFIFIFIYFFFDLMLKCQKEVAAGSMSADFARQQLLIWKFGDGLGALLHDPAHLYIIMGSLFLSLTIAYSRIKILLLSQKIDTLLVRYIGEETRDKLIRRRSGANSMRLTTVVLLCDIRDFTTLSEKADASDVVAMLNFYYGACHDVIKAYQGTINKFIGDAFLSFFDGTPSLAENSALAVQAALALLEQQGEMNRKLEAQHLPTIAGVGIGIHCGEVILGDIGGERKDYTLIGDTVNTTARLESLCKTYHTPLIVSEACYLLLDATVKQQFSRLSSLVLKGKAESVTFYGLKVH